MHIKSYHTAMDVIFLNIWTSSSGHLHRNTSLNSICNYLFSYPADLSVEYVEALRQSSF